jgi:hypothetical protein
VYALTPSCSLAMVSDEPTGNARRPDACGRNLTITVTFGKERPDAAEPDL